MEVLFKEHYSFLCLIAFGIVKDRHASKDITQEFFLSYWQKRDSITITTSFNAYASKAVKNLSLGFLKKVEKEKMLIQHLNVQKYTEQKVFDKTQHTGKIQELLNQLPEARRRIFISSVLHGQSYAEIAEMNGVSINTVKTQLKRAYSFLRANASEELLYLLLFVPFS